MQKVLTDGFSVTPDEARELMLHHLLLAQRFFEATPDGVDVTLAECARVFADDPAALAGATAFIRALDSFYEEADDYSGQEEEED